MTPSPTNTRLVSLGYNETRTYLLALLFVAGNVALPQLVHLIPRGGMVWLPIYFFTLVGAYKYGWRVGLLTAVASPVANHLLSGMPMAAMLPAILTKGVLLALAAGYAAHHWHRVTALTLMGVVAFYQVVGSLAEWAYTGSVMAALQDVRLGLPGMALQVVGGLWLIRHIRI